MDFGVWEVEVWCLLDLKKLMYISKALEIFSKLSFPPHHWTVNEFCIVVGVLWICTCGQMLYYLLFSGQLKTLIRPNLYYFCSTALALFCFWSYFLSSDLIFGVLA